MNALDIISFFFSRFRRLCCGQVHLSVEEKSYNQRLEATYRLHCCYNMIDGGGGGAEGGRHNQLSAKSAPL